MHVKEPFQLREKYMSGSGKFPGSHRLVSATNQGVDTQMLNNTNNQPMKRRAATNAKWSLLGFCQFQGPTYVIVKEREASFHIQKAFITVPN